MLDHPSLAERLPNGLIATNDDYRDRVVVINPLTKHIVWQYGHTDSPGNRPGPAQDPRRVRPPHARRRHADAPVYRLTRLAAG